MSWFLRKALPYATVTLHVREYPDSTNPQVYHIDIDQVITGGITGSKEARQLDWQEREHTDNIFGKLNGRSRFIRGVKGDDGKVRPAVEVQTKVGEPESDAKVQRFLRGEVLIDGSASEGFLVDEEGAEFGEGEGLYLQSWVVNEESGWTAEQVCINITGTRCDQILTFPPFRSGDSKLLMASAATLVALLSPRIPRIPRSRWHGLFTPFRSAGLRSKRVEIE